jgi:hypothetical protein
VHVLRQGSLLSRLLHAGQRLIGIEMAVDLEKP